MTLIDEDYKKGIILCFWLFVIFVLGYNLFVFSKPFILHIVDPYYYHWYSPTFEEITISDLIIPSLLLGLIIIFSFFIYLMNQRKQWEINTLVGLLLVVFSYFLSIGFYLLSISQL